MKSNFDLNISDNPEEKGIQEQILKHIEGCIIGPVIVYLGMTGMFYKYFMETSFQAAEFHKKAENFEVILDFLNHLGWFRKTETTINLQKPVFIMLNELPHME